MITAEDFDRIRGAYGRHASWAVWGDPAGTVPVTADDLAFPAVTPELLQVLHVDLVTVGLNPGDGFASRDWANFHTAAKSNDHVLGEALRGTPAWGAYMTDPLPAVIETRSALVNPEQGALTELIAEVTAAGNADPVFLAFGTKVRAILADAPSIIGRPVRMIPLTHYSGAARGAVTKEYERRFGPSTLPVSAKYAELVRVQIDEGLAAMT